MAKTYAAELLLKNKGIIESLDKSIKKTKELKKELNSLSKNPIKIEAKMGSSFKNVQANINRIAPKSKTIKIEAAENVTKTMNNVSRNMFEMSNKMNSTINSSMKGWSTNLSATLPKLQTMANTMAAVSNMSKLASMSSASALAGAGAGAVGVATLSKKNKTNTTNAIPIDVSPSFGSKLLNSGIKAGMKYSKGFRDAMMNKTKEINGIVGQWVNTSFSKGGIFSSTGSGLEELISKQKSKLESLGMKNPLSKWKENFETVGPEEDIFLGYERSWNKTISKMVSGAKSKFSRISNSIKTSLGTAADYIRSKFNSSIFNNFKQGAISSIQTVSNKAKQITYSIKFACDRGIYFFNYFASKGIISVARLAGNIKTKLANAFSSIKSYASKAASYIPAPFRAAFSTVTKVSKTAATAMYTAYKTIVPRVASAITSGIGGALRKVASMAKTTLKGLGVAFAGAIGFGVKDMASQEQNLLSMSHFISAGDAKKNGVNTITSEEADSKAQGYFNNLTNLANTTPFQNADIYNAGRRMLQTFQGDVTEAENMTKLAADMAALNPGKSALDAAEALADLAVGETERLKEFGLKISQDELKAMVRGTTGGDSLTQDEILKAMSMMTSSGGDLYEMFDGGADKLSGTLGGKFSTVMGKFRQMMSDSMKPFSDMFKGTLDNVIGYLDGEFKTNFVNAFGKIAQFTADLFSGDSSNFPIIDSLITAFETLKDAVVPVFDVLNEKFGLIFDSADNSFGSMGSIIEGAADVIAGVITGLTPILELISPIFNWIKETAIAVWPVVQGVIDVGSQIIKDAVEKLKPAFDAVTDVIGYIGDIFAEVWPGIQETIMSVWEKLQPVLDLFSSLCQLVADIFAIAWPPIAGIVETLWGIIGPIFEGMADMLGWIADLCTKVVDGIGGAINKVKESKWNPFNWFDGKEDGSHAYGLNRVPKDGYKATLHEGERVLTAREARQMDATTNNSNITISAPISINGVSDPDTTARLVVEKLKETIGNTYVKSFA